MTDRIERIITIEGLWRHDEQLARALCGGLAKQFPEACIIPESLWGCWPFEIPRLVRFVDSLAEKYDDGIETMLVGHSMGGIIACALEERLINTRIVGITTICSPHTYCSGIFPYLIGVNNSPRCRIITFEARHDLLVLSGTRHPHTRKHMLLDCDHRDGFIRCPTHIEEIAKVSRAYFVQ